MGFHDCSSKKVQLCSNMCIFISGVLLVGCFITWIYNVTDKKTSYSQIMSCQLYYFFFFWLRHSSVWILTLMTGEKTLSIIFPFKAKMFSNIKMAKIVSAVTLVCLAFFDLKWIFGVRTVKLSNKRPDGCDYHLSSESYDYFIIFDDIFYSLLPCILIFFFNLTIIFKLLHSKFRSKQSNQTSAMSKTAMSTTLMLLSVSITFTILTSPAAIGYLIFLDFSTMPEVLYHISIYLYYVNHSCNALMYTMLSPRFRREIKKSLCKSPENHNRGPRNRVGPSETRESQCSASAVGNRGILESVHKENRLQHREQAISSLTQ